jgi:hypothetical protein
MDGLANGLPATWRHIVAAFPTPMLRGQPLAQVSQQVICEQCASTVSATGPMSHGMPLEQLGSCLAWPPSVLVGLRLCFASSEALAHCHAEHASRMYAAPFRLSDEQCKCLGLSSTAFQQCMCCCCYRMHSSCRIHERGRLTSLLHSASMLHLRLLVKREQFSLSCCGCSQSSDVNRVR